MNTNVGKSGLTRIMLAMANNALGDEVHVADPREKAAVLTLEDAGLVVVRSGAKRVGGFREWYFRLTSEAKLARAHELFEACIGTDDDAAHHEYVAFAERLTEAEKIALNERIAEAA